jgi:PEP-CTERM motif
MKKTTTQHTALALAALAVLASSHSAQAAENTTASVGEVLELPGPPLVFLGGTGALRFSNGGILDTGLLASGAKPAAVGGLVGALNTGKVALTSVDGSAITEKSVTLASGRAPRGIVSIGANVTSLSVNSNTGVIGQVTAEGGAMQTAPFIDGTLDGGQMTVNNLKIDLPNKLVYADMAYRALDTGGNYGPLVVNNNVALWNIGTIQGPTVLPPVAVMAAFDGDISPLQALGWELVWPTPEQAANLAFWSGQPILRASNTLGNLTVTDEGFAIFAAGLGLVGAPNGESNSIGYDALAGVNTRAGGWGSMTSDISLTTFLPEPSTYALMGLGLVGIAAVARRAKTHSSPAA